MPLYNIASTSAALSIPLKWLDNLLSHNKIDGVEQARQGVKRRLSIEAVAVVEISYRMVEATSMPIGQAVALAERLIWSPGNVVKIADIVTMSINREALEKALLHELELAVEVTPAPARGRPSLGASEGDRAVQGPESNEGTP